MDVFYIFIYSSLFLCLSHMYSVSMLDILISILAAKHLSQPDPQLLKQAPLPGDGTDSYLLEWANM